MKAKVLFGLALCCFLVSLGIMVGLTVSKSVQAQYHSYPPTSGLPIQANVKFAEDFMRQHGKQLRSFHGQGVLVQHVLSAIPPDKIFIVTDVCMHETAGTPTPSALINIQRCNPGLCVNFATILLDASNGYKASFNSGIVIDGNGEAGITLKVSSDVTADVTVSGYFVNS